MILRGVSGVHSLPSMGMFAGRVLTSVLQHHIHIGGRPPDASFSGDLSIGNVQ